MSPKAGGKLERSNLLFFILEIYLYLIFLLNILRPPFFYFHDSRDEILLCRGWGRAREKKDFYELITNENIYFQSLFLLIPISQGLPCAIKSPTLEFKILILIQVPLPWIKKFGSLDGLVPWGRELGCTNPNIFNDFCVFHEDSARIILFSINKWLW